MTRIYVASSWRNPYQPEVVAALRKAGHEVYDFRNPKDNPGGFHWADVDENWQDWQPEEYIRNLNLVKSKTAGCRKMKTALDQKK